ncbi:MAG: 1-phosphofructokinase family hexose kinase [Anaerolineae bacterium]
MILTLTTNAALDRILLIDEFTPGGIMRPPNFIDRVGGKGLDVSVALRAVGAETVAISAVGGDTGRRLAGLLAGYGITTDLIWLEGETRLAHVIAEQRANRHSHIIAGNLPVTPEAVTQFLDRLQTHLPRAAWLVAGGTLPQGMPPDFYRQITALARQAGVPVLLDITGPPVAPALAQPPAVLKLNRQEFAATFAAPPTDSIAGLVEQAAAVVGRHRLPALVLTCGEDGLLGFTPEGVFRAVPPPQQAVNAAGAGDVSSAGLVWRLSLGDGWPEALRWAAALSAASVLTIGTADVNLPDAERILPAVTVEPL